MFGPLTVAGEGGKLWLNRIDAVNNSFTGYYGYAAYMLTGETRPFKGGNFDRIRPFHELGNGGLGAFEVALRYDHINLTDTPVPARAGNEASSVTAGLNWYFNPYAKLMFNWVRFSGDNTPSTRLARRPGAMPSRRASTWISDEFVMPSASPGRSSPLPGFGLSLGITIMWLSLIVLVPLSAVFLKSASDGWHTFWSAAFSPRALAAYRLSFGAAALAAAVNCIFGLLVAWVLVRYTFPGRRLFGALIDLPFALPTAVAGIALTALYSDTGIIGQFLEPAGLPIAYRPAGVVVALTFIGLPFVVRHPSSRSSLRPQLRWRKLR